jgi:hypothetical protein
MGRARTIIKEKKTERKAGRGRRSRCRHTSDGDVGEAVRAADVDGVGEDPEERLGDEREVPSVLHELQRGGAEAEAAGEVEVERQPREAAEPLHPVPDPAHPPHAPHLPQRAAPLRRRPRRRRRGGGALELGPPLTRRAPLLRRPEAHRRAARCHGGWHERPPAVEVWRRARREAEHCAWLRRLVAGNAG